MVRQFACKQQEQRIRELETEVTEHKQAEKKVVHLNLALQAIRNVNHLIAKEKDRDRLLNGICDNLVHTRGFFNAWIALMNANQEVIATAESGLGENFSLMAALLKSGRLTECGQKALGQQEAVVINNPKETCLDCPLSDKYGDRGAMTVRLEYDGKLYGVLSTSIPKVYLEDQEELVLLQDMAREIGFALHNLEIEKERVRAEQALKDSEAQKQAILDASVDRIQLSNPDMRIIWANETHKRELAIVPEALAGKACYEVFANRNTPCPECPGTKAIQSGKTEHAVLVQKKQGNGRSEKYLDSYAVPIKNGSGEIVHLLRITRDITAKKEAEKALQLSEERYRVVIDHAGEGILVVQDNMLKFVNPKASEIAGYPPDELYTRPFTDFIYPEDIPMVVDNHERRLRGEEPPSIYTFRIIDSEGNIHWLEINAVLIDWEGSPAALTFLRDTTEQQNLEAQLIQAQKMEAIGTLAGGIAHDFNNLLMGILGFTSLMLMDLDAAHPHNERLKGIEGLVQSGAELTRQLLGFARGGKYEVKPIDVNELVEKSSGMFERTKKEIAVHRRHQKDIWSIEADPNQIEQVLLNLYVNAWQAMPQGGELYLSTENVVLDEQFMKPYKVKPGRYVKITVRDTGIGMDQATKNRIFEPFFTTKEMGRGTGLGLASVYGIVKNHSGYINVYSEEAKGTAFTIYLPASDKDAKNKRMESREQPIHYGHEIVLLVDDEAMVLQIGEEMLTSLGYTVLTATNGNEALEVYEKGKQTINLVILDMIMPTIGGGEVYDQLKQINPAVKVLLSSGYSIDGQAMEIIKRGCNGFIQKPFDLRELSRKIRDALDEK